MSSMNIHIGNCFVGFRKAYIYIIYSKQHSFAYVGETNSRGGVISRFCGHIQTRAEGTLRKRLFERQGIKLDEVNDLTIFAYELPNETRFLTEETSFRRGVEFLVQKRLWEICGDLQPYILIISHVEYNDTGSLYEIRKVANEVFESFRNAYNYPQGISE